MSVAGTTSTFAKPGGVVSDRPSPGYDHVLERRRAVALARHFRGAEGLSIGQIADRLGRSPATIKAYFYDPSHANKRPTRRAGRSRRVIEPLHRASRSPSWERAAKAGGREFRESPACRGTKRSSSPTDIVFVLELAVQHVR
jgi:transposase